MCLSRLLLEISLDYFFPIYVCVSNQSCENISKAVFNSYQARSLIVVIQTIQVISDFHFYPFPTHRHDSDYLYIEMLLGNFPSVSLNPIPFQEQSISFSFLSFKAFLWTKVTQGYMTKDFSVAVISHGRCNLIIYCWELSVIDWFVERIQFEFAWDALLNPVLYGSWLLYNAFLPFVHQIFLPPGVSSFVWILATWIVVHTTVVSPFPRKFLEMETLRSHPRLTESESIFLKDPLSRWFIHT